MSQAILWEALCDEGSICQGPDNPANGSLGGEKNETEIDFRAGNGGTLLRYISPARGPNTKPNPRHPRNSILRLAPKQTKSNQNRLKSTAIRPVK